MALTYQEVLDLINNLLPDNTTQQISEKDLRDVATAILDRTNQSNIEDLNIEWDVATTYALDEIVTYLDRIWKSKSAGNVGHQPPSDPGITENTYWIEQSRSESVNFPEWSAGVYGSGLIIVYYNNQLYKLNVGTRPFNSTNIVNEIAAGDWRLLTGILNLGTLTDGATVNLNCLNAEQAKAYWSTAQSAPTLNLSGLGKIADVSIKKTISGDSVVTIQGTGYKFINMDNKTLPATSVNITLSDSVNFFFEISLKYSGITDGGSKVILIQYK